MGNCAGKKPSKHKDNSHHDLDRKRIYQAQDSFVRGIIDKEDGAKAGEDTDSVGPGKDTFIFMS